MMFQAKLRRMDAPSYKCTVIEFPAIEYQFQEQLGGIGVGITTAKNCFVEEMRADNGGLQSLVGWRVNADELQYLAKRMDSFDRNEFQTFYAAIHAEKPQTVKDMINLTFNLHCYTAVADFSDLAKIGTRYELNRQGCMTQSEMNNTDFAAIGRQLIDGGKGEVTPFGVLYRNGNEQEQPYNGRQFPQYFYRGDDAALVTLTFDGNHEYLYLPCAEVEIEKAANRLGLPDASACETQLECERMSDKIYQLFTEDYPLSEHLCSMNELARCYTGFDDAALQAFHAIVELAEPKTPEDVVVLGQNFYEFSAVPDIRSAEEYGRYRVKQNCEIGMNLENYIDFKRFGEDMIVRENGVFTDFGYIAYFGDTPAVLELLNPEQPEQAQGMCMEMQ